MFLRGAVAPDRDPNWIILLNNFAIRIRSIKSSKREPSSCAIIFVQLKQILQIKNNC